MRSLQFRKVTCWPNGGASITVRGRRVAANVNLSPCVIGGTRPILRPPAHTAGGTVVRPPEGLEGLLEGLEVRVFFFL